MVTPGNQTCLRLGSVIMNTTPDQRSHLRFRQKSRAELMVPCSTLAICLQRKRCRKSSSYVYNEHFISQARTRPSCRKFRPDDVWDLYH